MSPLPIKTSFKLLDKVWKASKEEKRFTDVTKKEDVRPVYIPGFKVKPDSERRPNALMKRILHADYRAAGNEFLDLLELYDEKQLQWGYEGGTYYIVLKTGPDLDFFAQSSSNSMTTSTLRSSFKAKYRGM